MRILSVSLSEQQAHEADENGISNQKQNAKYRKLRKQ